MKSRGSPRTPGLATAAALAVAAALGVAAPASAQFCTLGVDTPASTDRAPSACERVDLKGNALAPVTGGDGAVWTVVGNDAVRAADGTSRRFALTARIAALGAGSVHVGTGPAGAAVAAGNSVQTFAGDGSGFTGVLEGVANGAPTTVGDTVLVPTHDGFATAKADGTAGLVQTQAAAPTGDAVNSGGSVWYASGAGVGRLGADGSVRRVALGGAVVALSPADKADGLGVWVALGNKVVHVADDGKTDHSYTLSGTATGVTAGEGENTIWVATQGMNLLTRLATRSFGGGRQADHPCDRKNAAGCQDSVKAVSDGLATDFTPPGGAGTQGTALGGDGIVYTASGSGLFGARTYRGLLPCARNGVLGPRNAYACRSGTWSAFVTGRPIAYPRVSCLRLGFRYCAGTATLRYKGRKLGSTRFLMLTYDNPKLRVGLSKADYRLIKRKRNLHASFEVTSVDGGGISRTASYPIVLFPGSRSRG